VTPDAAAESRLRRRAREARAAFPVEWRYVVRIVVTAAVAWQVCVWLGATQPPVYAVIVPLVAPRDSPYSAFAVSFGRLVGVVAGLGIGIAVLSALRPGALAVAVVLAAALLVAIALRSAGTLNVQVAISALLVFANPAPESYAVARLWETGVGAVVTVVLALVLLPTNPVRAFLADRARVATDLAAALRAAAELAGTDPATARPRLAELATTVRATEEDARALDPKLLAARRAARFTPLWWRRDAARLPDAPTPGAADLAAMARLFVDELRELATREDTAAWWAACGPPITRTVDPLATAVGARLSGAPDPTAEGAARAALLDYAAADPSRFGVVVRRPLRRALLLVRGED
jgi:hypothetical protein